MSKKPVFTYQQRDGRARTMLLKLGQIIVLLSIVSFLVGPVNAAPAERPMMVADANWMAYNDCNLTTGEPTYHITTVPCNTQVDPNTQLNQMLINYANGEGIVTNPGDPTAEPPIPPTYILFDVVVVGAVNPQPSGAETAAGTDAYTTFHGKAGMVGGGRISSDTTSVTLTFKNLDPTKKYTFVTSANRAAAYLDRASQFILGGVCQTCFTADSSTKPAPGAYRFSTTYTDDSVVITTGENTTNGYVARWTGINPGSDGSFSVRIAQYAGSSESYGPAVFMLQEDKTSIQISGTPLNAFTTPRGTPSAEQSYTVWGTDLTDNITITAPTNFQISKTSGTGWASSLTLTQSGGNVPATPIYVRFNRNTGGTSSGDIVHTSSGATTKNVAVTGTATTDNPVITEESPVLVTMSEDGSPTAFILTLHASDQNPEDTLTWTISSPATHGTAHVTSGTGTTQAIGYTPNADYFGTDSFDVKVADGQGGEDTATVEVTITNVNDKPVANAQTITTTEDTGKSITLTGTDVDGDTLTFYIVTPPVHGNLTGNGANVIYTPNRDYYGSDSFTFRTRDGAVYSDSAIVSITVTPVNDAPVALNDIYYISPNDAVTIPAANGVLANDTDADDTTLTATVVSSPVYGSLSFNAANGSFTYTPQAGYIGAVSFTYQANDGDVNSNVAQVQIYVRNKFYLPYVVK